jgi:dipeptide/tripeptide permease
VAPYILSMAIRCCQFLVALVMSFDKLRVPPSANAVITPALMALIFTIPAYPIIEIIAMRNMQSTQKEKALVIDCFLAAGYVLFWFVLLVVGSVAVI